MSNQRAPLSLRTKTLIAIVVVAVVAVFTLTPPIPQDLAYHHFIDQRDLLGIANFWNVISNLPFLIVGVAGLSIVFLHADEVCVREASAAYVTLFSGIVLTAFGSAYYHLAPSNETLVWDRLPMTIGFAGLLCVIVAEFISPAVARRLLLPLLIIGFGWRQLWARGTYDKGGATAVT